MNLTQKLKAELWRRFGSPEHPAEWDGKVLGGGKLSQRYWEYFKSVELLDLDENSVVLDIGGGSPMTGMGFFSSLLATAVKKIIVMDPNIASTAIAPANVEFVRSRATYEELREIFVTRPELTHVISVSVFEHIEQPVREEIVRGINDFFSGRSFVTTFEYHAKTQFFRYNLTARNTSLLFRPLTNFYPDRFHASPVWSEDAFDHTRILRFCYKSLKKVFAYSEVPRWYPIAVRFVRL